MAFRLDVMGSASPTLQRTPGGGIRVPANLTRTGVFVYHQTDGSTIRELRHPAEVFDETSLDSLADAPVTIGHPGTVTAETWRKDSVGHVSGVKRDGRFVAAKLVVSDADAVGQVTRKDLTELSCGYTCDVVMGKGVYDGEEYDAQQSNIRYNHVGMGPRNWGRAGNEVRIKIDHLDGGLVSYEDAVGEDAPRPCYIGGMTLDEALALIKVQADSLAQLKADSDKTAAQRDGLVVENEKLRADAVTLKADSAEDKISARVDARVALLDGARKVLPDVDSKLTDAALMVAVISKTDAKFDATGKSIDYLRGRFDVAVSGYSTAQGQLEQLRATVDNAGAPPKEDPEATFRAKQANAWKVKP